MQLSLNKKMKPGKVCVFLFMVIFPLYLGLGNTKKGFADSVQASLSSVADSFQPLRFFDLKTREGRTCDLRRKIWVLREFARKMLFSSRRDHGNNEPSKFIGAHLLLKCLEDEVLEIDAVIKNMPIAHLKDDKGHNALHLSALIGNLDLVTLSLIKWNGHIDINERDNQGQTPLHLASKRGYSDIVLFLIAFGVDGNVKNEKLQTPFHLSSAGGHWLSTLLLVRVTKNVGLKDKEGKTPAKLAWENGHYFLGMLIFILKIFYGVTDILL